LITLKHKEVLRESIAEYGRRGNFVRIFPAQGTNKYDKYFKNYRPYNNFLYKCLYTSDIFPDKIEETFTPVIKPLNSVSQMNSINNESNSTRNSQAVNESELDPDKARKRPQTVNPASIKAIKNKENKEYKCKCHPITYIM
jgi:hypothetical protein